MISQIQSLNTLEPPSKPVNSRAPEFYTQGSSFHDLFTAPDAPASAPEKTVAAPGGAPVSTPVSALLGNALPVNAAPVAAPVKAPVTAPVTAAATPAPTPTFEQGAVVTAPDGTTTPLNSLEMASASTAAQIATKLGGTVTADQFGGGFSTSADIREISFTGSNVKINAGLAANLFAAYGDAPGSEAWRVINSAFGRDPMATGPVS